jgi:hypothetical protein
MACPISFFCWLSRIETFCSGPGTTHFNLRRTRRGLASVAGAGYVLDFRTRRAVAHADASISMGVTSDGGKFIAYIVGRFCNCIAPVCAENQILQC